MMTTKTKDSKRSFKSLSQTIHSLLGFKTQANSNWADTVCEIIKSLPSTADYDHERVNGYENENENDDSFISRIHGELAALTEEVSRLNAQRRQVLNEFLKLKGNIRVFCRIRPVIDGGKFGHRIPVVPVDSSGILLNFAENKSKLYNFDKVFNPGSSQDEVFSEIEPVIKSALDGYNVCILAYGQTGTGKTFTMEGSPGYPGVVPRTIEALFKQAADSNYTYLFSFSMLEIYLGHLKDLLVHPAKKTSDPMPPCLSVQTDPSGGIVIDNLVAIQVSDFNHAVSLYRLGSRFRSTASTNSNKTSSRSHCMIRMSMTCSDAIERRKMTNKIWMVDLGGSERVLKTKAWGRRFEEGKAINLSLSALGDVISALQRKNSHIPYRNSKLTQVLKDSLGEDSKTLVLVHVSPNEEDLCETVCSLNFASRLRSIHLGKTESNDARVIREVAMTNLQRKMKQIEDNRDDLRKEIKKLNQKLESLTKTSPGSKEKLDESLLPSKVPRANAEIAGRIEIIAKPPSSKMPRFMKPTICSTRKTGMSQEISYKKGKRPERRKQLPIARAESVSFPIKSMTESCTESSISRASCLVGLNGILSADSETEYSQDTSQCNFRMAIDKQGNSSKNSTDQSIHSSLSDIESSSMKTSEVNHWLYLHEDTTNRTSYAPQNKRVLSIPTPVKKSRVIEEMKKKKTTEREIHDYKSTKVNQKPGEVEMPSSGEITGRPIADTPRNLPSADTKFVGEESRFNPIPSIDGTKTIIGVDGTYIEGDIYCQIRLPISMNGSDHQNNHVYDVDYGVEEVVISQGSTHETRHPEANDNLPADPPTSDVDSSDAGHVESSKFSTFISELKSPSKKVPTGMGENNEEPCVPARNSESGEKSCALDVRALRVPSLDSLILKDFTKLSCQTHRNMQHKGLSDILKENFMILYNSVLLGLGFQSLGFDHDFFQALMH